MAPAIGSGPHSECIRQAQNLLKQNRAGQAQSVLEDCLSRWPESPKASLLLGYALARQRKFKQAEKHFLKAAKLADSPMDRISVHLGLAAVMDNLGKTAEADEHYAAALAIDPSLSAVLDEVQKQRLWPKSVYRDDESDHGGLDDRLRRIEKRLKALER